MSLVINVNSDPFYMQRWKFIKIFSLANSDLANFQGCVSLEREDQEAILLIECIGVADFHCSEMNRWVSGLPSAVLMFLIGMRRESARRAA